MLERDRAALEAIRTKPINGARMTDSLSTPETPTTGFVPSEEIPVCRRCNNADERFSHVCVNPAAPAQAETPTLASLYGIAPDLTGGVESSEFIRRKRDAQAEQEDFEKLLTAKRFRLSMEDGFPHMAEREFGEYVEYKEFSFLCDFVRRLIEQRDEAQRAKEYDDADMKKLGEWVQGNLSTYAGLSWSEGIAREVESLRARVRELEARPVVAYVPIAGELLSRLTDDWSGPVQIRVEKRDGNELVLLCRDVSTVEERTTE